MTEVSFCMINFFYSSHPFSLTPALFPFLHPLYLLYSFAILWVWPDHLMVLYLTTLTIPHFLIFTWYSRSLIHTFIIFHHTSFIHYKHFTSSSYELLNLLSFIPHPSLTCICDKSLIIIIFNLNIDDLFTLIRCFNGNHLNEILHCMNSNVWN